MGKNPGQELFSRDSRQKSGTVPDVLGQLATMLQLETFSALVSDV